MYKVGQNWFKGSFGFYIASKSVYGGRTRYDIIDNYGEKVVGLTHPELKEKLKGFKKFNNYLTY